MSKPKSRTPQPASSLTLPETRIDPRIIAEQHYAYMVQYEDVLIAALTPDGEQVELNALCDMFDATVLVSHTRRVTDENFVAVLARCTRVHCLAAKLTDCTFYGQEMKKLGQETPNIDSAGEKIITEIGELRVAAVKDLTLLHQCASPLVRLS
jgi:hypothetical protein